MHGVHHTMIAASKRQAIYGWREIPWGWWWWIAQEDGAGDCAEEFRTTEN